MSLDNNYDKKFLSLIHLLQMSDSAFPVGTFSFSNGLETASHLGIVKDASTLEQYCASIARQAAFSDGVSAILSYRSARRAEIEEIVAIDKNLMLFKMNDESRLMLKRMGKKLAELSFKLFPDNKIVAEWLVNINNERTPGSYPVTQGVVFAAADISEEELFVSHQYGVINMVCSAALRCVRVSHFDTQIIIQRIGSKVKEWYDEARMMTLDDMNSFVPEADIFSSIHEKGIMRMFMN